MNLVSILTIATRMLGSNLAGLLVCGGSMSNIVVQLRMNSGGSGLHCLLKFQYFPPSRRVQEHTLCDAVAFLAIGIGVAFFEVEESTRTFLVAGPILLLASASSFSSSSYWRFKTCLEGGALADWGSAWGCQQSVFVRDGSGIRG
jgi:hypothetical protein